MKTNSMVVVDCPLTGCQYRTPDQEPSIVAALLQLLFMIESINLEAVFRHEGQSFNAHQLVPVSMKRPGILLSGCGRRIKMARTSMIVTQDYSCFSALVTN